MTEYLPLDSQLRCGRLMVEAKVNIEKVKKHLARIRKLVAQTHSPFAGMTKYEAIEKMRKAREKLWEGKLAARH